MWFPRRLRIVVLDLVGVCSISKMFWNDGERPTIYICLDNQHLSFHSQITDRNNNELNQYSGHISLV